MYINRKTSRVIWIGSFNISKCLYFLKQSIDSKIPMAFFKEMRKKILNSCGNTKEPE